MKTWDKDFDKEFDKEFATMTKAIIGVWIVSALIALATIAGVTFVVYKLLVHFGVL